MKFLKLNVALCSLALLGGLLVSTVGFAQENARMKYYLMIGEPTTEIWNALVKSGGKDMTTPGRKATEALGGKIISYYIGATEARNYIIVAYPDSTDVSNIVYMRAAQGVMKNLQFIEIIPAEEAHVVFEKITLK